MRVSHTKNFIDFFLSHSLSLSLVHGNKLLPLLPLCAYSSTYSSNHRDIISLKTTAMKKKFMYHIFIYRIKSDKNGSEKVLTMSKNIGINNFFFLCQEKKEKQYHNNNKKAVTNEIKSVTRHVCVCAAKHYTLLYP